MSKKIINTKNSQEFFNESYINLSITDSPLDFSVPNKKIQSNLISMVKRSRSIIDLGCGQGITLRIFRKLNKNALLTGIDFSNVALEHARKRMKKDKKIKLINNDLNNIDLTKEKYDLVYCSQVLEHLSQSQKFLNNIYKSLKPNGSLILCTVYKKNWAWYFYKNKFNQPALSPDHINEYKKIDDLLNQCKKSGFKKYQYSLEQFKYPLVDPIIKLSFKFFKNKKFFNSNFMAKIRSLTMIPILGFYNFQVICRK
ncbi:MAG TPA: class I SAM-dependent methyltransferase [Candidatus Woesebacteria bacterium]|jgi:ubiquinone/menaquinone biosynthesis C-methylase UbiE|nr:class I SAM-dependent methyltransferase [Candidatus Shapirobacteria bacterium]HOR02094.1 class I SAM-dependent methyltransferase [Candidatus Woesebacteria bacterium]